MSGCWWRMSIMMSSVHITYTQWFTKLELHFNPITIKTKNIRIDIQKQTNYDEQLMFFCLILNLIKML